MRVVLSSSSQARNTAGLSIYSLKLSFFFVLPLRKVDALRLAAGLDVLVHESAQQRALPQFSLSISA
jgi:hypothetical protein